MAMMQSIANPGNPAAALGVAGAAAPSGAVSASGRAAGHHRGDALQQHLGRAVDEVGHPRAGGMAGEGVLLAQAKGVAALW